MLLPITNQLDKISLALSISKSYASCLLILDIDLIFELGLLGLEWLDYPRANLRESIQVERPREIDYRLPLQTWIMRKASLVVFIVATARILLLG
jgi:hypothetical protein